ncbi:MAG: hypothetical protein GTN99_07950 [Candidatus Dadabacteria bacterium]|nr:hypothetical protein [Candidatus Dadabacteria bacterium]
MIKTILNTFIIIFVLTVYSYSDTVVKMEYKDNFSKTINKNTNSFKGSDMRMDFYEGGEHLTSTMIFKGSQNRMINLDHRSKTYYLMDG